MRTNDTNRRDIAIKAISLLNLHLKGHITEATEEIGLHCPFHEDKNPSCYINLNSGVYHCFSCGRSGSIETLFKELTGQSIRNVLGISSDRFSNYALNSKYKGFNYDIIKKKSVYVNYNPKDFVDAYNNSLCSKYLQDRGISQDIAKSMNMLYTDYAEINTTRFIRRLIIPVYEDKTLVAVEGRRINPEDPDPKVLYAKNCSVNTLFDIDKLDKTKPLYVVEGLMDLAVLRSCDEFKNSSSIFGANLTLRQRDLLKEFNQVVYIPDADTAGESTVDTLRDMHSDNIYILRLPKTINGIPIKDVGDIPKTSISVQDLVDRKWLTYIQKLN